MQRLTLLALVLAVASLTACGTVDDGLDDDMVSDATSDMTSDTSTADTSTTDTALIDTSTTDTTVEDTSTGDTSTTDATDTGDMTATSEIEVAGTWETQFMTTEVIDDARWDFMLMTEFDNDANVAITQNPSDAEFGADTFNRLHWTEPAADGSFAYCTVDFGLTTAGEARNSTNTADESDLEAGCGGFSWTTMTAAQ